MVSKDSELVEGSGKASKIGASEGLVSTGGTFAGSGGSAS